MQFNGDGLCKCESSCILLFYRHMLESGESESESSLLLLVRSVQQNSAARSGRTIVLFDGYLYEAETSFLLFGRHVQSEAASASREIYLLFSLTRYQRPN
jgi:hypothetical protein